MSHLRLVVNNNLDALRYKPKGAVKIAVKDTNVIIYVSQFTKRDGKEVFSAVAYSGKRTKPDFNYIFRNAERREDYVKEYIERVKVNAQEKAKRKEQERIDRERAKEAAKVGDILHYSWGYDQTNCEFYQVTKVKGSHLWMRRIGAKAVKDSQSFMSESLVANKDDFIQNEPELKKLIQGCSADRLGNPRYSVSMDFGCAALWDGSPCYSSWYA